MKISNVSNAYNVYATQKSKEVRHIHKSEEKKDALAISDTAKDYQTVAKALAKTPDIRQTKVDDIKAKIDNGTYSVSNEELANKMLSRFFV